MKIAFVPFSVKCPQHANTGSIRIRVVWPIKHLENAIIAESPEMAMDSDIIVFQKVYGLVLNQKAMHFKKMGKIIVFDICDPDWLIPHNDFLVKEMMAIADHVTVPTEKMGILVNEIVNTPVTVIQDGMDLNHHNKFKINYETQGLPKLVWFGNRGTISALQFYIPQLEELYKLKKFELRVITDGGEVKTIIPTEHLKWDIETVNDQIIECDVAINPKTDSPMDYPKSNNKTLTAWACGLPCVEVWPDTKESEWKWKLFEFLGNKDFREKEGKAGRKKVVEEFNTEIMAGRWKNLFYYLMEQKHAKNQDTNDASECERSILSE